MSKIPFSKIIALYRDTAIFTFNTILIFLLAVLAIIWLEYSIDNDPTSPDANPLTRVYGEELAARAHPNMTAPERNRMLYETYLGREYEPYTQFKERARHGRYVNISTDGYRYVENQGEWPPNPSNYNVFVFGGSTTFGYGTTDTNTIPSLLQAILEKTSKQRVKVYNFGRGNYYSTQERILFEKLILGGQTPDLAVFIDGLNDFYYYPDLPHYSEMFTNILNDGVEKSLVLRSIVKFKRSFIGNIKKLLKRMNTPLKQKNTDNVVFNAEKYNDSERNKQVIERYISNKRITESIAKAYDVATAFIWQPVPTYKYDVQYHLFSDYFSERHNYSHFGYSDMRIHYESGVLGNNFYWAANIQENLQKSLYVDTVHYNPEMNYLIAKEIAGHVTSRSKIKL